MTTATDVPPQARSVTPTERILTGSLVVAPVLYLSADTTYALEGWDSAVGGVLHVLGAIAYGFVVLRVVAWLPAASRLAAALLVCGLVAMVGNAAYGFEAIHMSLGDTQLVDQAGAANLIKPLGLFVPISFALIAVTLHRLGLRAQAALVAVTVVLWPVAHIGNIAALAVVANLALVVAFGSLIRYAPATGAGGS